MHDQMGQAVRNAVAPQTYELQTSPLTVTSLGRGKVSQGVSEGHS